MVISCDSILLGQTCNLTRFISFSKQLENIMGSDLPDSHALNTQLESLIKKVIQLCQENKEQHKTLNRVKNFLEQFVLEMDNINRTLQVLTPTKVREPM